MHCTKVRFAKIYSGVNIFTFHIRAVGRAENPGVAVSFGGHNQEGAISPDEIFAECTYVHCRTRPKTETCI